MTEIDPASVRGGPVPSRVACIGECMVEFKEQPDGLFQRSYGGDTLNTAVYLARLGVAVDYVTAVGDDAWSDEMLAFWRAEGVGTGLVPRLPGRLPGLYVIQTDGRGERRFLYWRDSAAARHLFDHFDPARLDAFDVLYVSGITLSIYPHDVRERLFGVFARARARGARVVFDTNFRSRGWPDLPVARTVYETMLAAADIVLASVEDLVPVFGPAYEAALLRHARRAEVALRLSHPASRVRHDGGDTMVQASPVARVVDTTAAGDSFAAAYLAARLGGASPETAARAGHALAGVVVGHPGAVIARAAMPPSTWCEEAGA